MHTKDSVSAGFIAFSGLAKTMSKQTTSHSSVRIAGQYLYKDDQFDKGGQWEWFADEQGYATITDTSTSNAHLSANIDEDIKIDLNPYGKDHTFTWNFSCSGKVTVEQNYQCKLPTPPVFQGMPHTTIRVRPEAIVVASKNVSLGSYFTTTDKLRVEATKTFPHPALLEIEIIATPLTKEPTKSAL